MTIYLITGVGGFIGTNLAMRLLDQGSTVIGLDRCQIHNKYNLENLSAYVNFKFVEFDLNRGFYIGSEPIDVIFHLASLADIRFSVDQYSKHYAALDATINVLETMNHNNIKKIAYASSAAVYGDGSDQVHEYIHPTQTSYYGAEKIAGEAFIEAYCEAHDARASIFRYVSILGERYSHGLVYNFYRELKKHPGYLYVHGSGTQVKSYLYVQDCIDAMLIALDEFMFDDGPKSRIYNVAHPDAISLNESIPIITKHMGITPDIIWSGNERGWIGDSLVCRPSPTKLQGLGWRPQLTIPQAIERTLVWLDSNQWILNQRDEF